MTRKIIHKIVGIITAVIVLLILGFIAYVIEPDVREYFARDNLPGGIYIEKAQNFNGSSIILNIKPYKQESQTEINVFVVDVYTGKGFPDLVPRNFAFQNMAYLGTIRLLQKNGETTVHSSDPNFGTIKIAKEGKEYKVTGENITINGENVPQIEFQQTARVPYKGHRLFSF